MEKEINNFISYLHNIKKTSNNTELSYKRDLGKLRQYLEEKDIVDVNAITSEILKSYIVYLGDNHLQLNHIQKCRFHKGVLSLSVQRGRFGNRCI